MRPRTDDTSNSIGDPDRPDDEGVLAALAEVIAGPEAASNPSVADRAHQLAADIMGTHGEVRRERLDDGPPVGSD